MELVQGMNLRQWLAASSRSLEEVLKTLCAAGDGLVAAHTAGLIHRDFKPRERAAHRGRRREGDRLRGSRSLSATAPPPSSAYRLRDSGRAGVSSSELHGAGGPSSVRRPTCRRSSCSARALTLAAINSVLPLCSTKRSTAHVPSARRRSRSYAGKLRAGASPNQREVRGFQAGCAECSHVRCPWRPASASLRWRSCSPPCGKACGLVIATRTPTP